MGKTVTSFTEVRTKDGVSNKGPWLLSIFKAADGREYSTFKGELASKANSLLNQTVEVEYSEKQNGQFTNYTLEGVQAASAGEVAVVTGAGSPAITENNTYPGGGGVNVSKNDQFRTKEQIMRTDALNITTTLFGVVGLDPLSAPEEFEGWLESFYKYIEQGVFETPDVRVEA